LVACGSAEPSAQRPIDARGMYAEDLARSAAAHDAAAIRRMLRDSVINAGLWFGDHGCQQRFGPARAISGHELDDLASCLAKLDLRPSERLDALPDVSPLLIAAERWADAGALYDEPLTTLERAAEMLAHTTTRELPPGLIEHMRHHLRETAAVLVRALRAAGRASDADAVDHRARELDPSGEMATALSGGPGSNA
jgi:hypothetical protein